MGITWRQQMSVGIKEIDDDHRQLIAIISDFNFAAESRSGQIDEGNMRVILAKLQRYAREHFDREEKLQLACNYPGHAENKKQHELLTRQLDDFTRLYTDGKLGSAKSATILMSKFLNRWLVDHILKVDLKMRGMGGPG